MADDGKIVIVIKSEIDSSTSSSVSTTKDKVEQEKSSLDYAKHRFFSFIESEARQITISGINNIGNFTGDYITQRKISESVQAVNIGLNIGMSAVAGFKIAGPLGAIVSGAVSMIGFGISNTISYYQGLTENRKTNYNIEQLRKRAGLNTVYDGSRGTEN